MKGSSTVIVYINVPCVLDVVCSLTLTGIMFLKLAVSLFLIGCVTSQTKYCCLPPQWETAYYLITGSMNQGKFYYTQLFQNVSVDGNAHKLAASGSSTSNGYNSTYKVIQDFDGGKQYTIINGTCQSSPLGAWTPYCVPDDAKIAIKTYFGTGDHKIDFDTYMFVSDGTTYYIDIASADCTLLYLSTHGGNANSPDFQVGTYTNFTLGIKDPSVFTIPDICNKPIKTNFPTRPLGPIL